MYVPVSPLLLYVVAGELTYSFLTFCSVFSAIVFGAFSLGQAMAFAPDYSKARLAAARVFDLLDLKPSIDSSSDDGIVPVGCTILLQP